MKLNWDRDYPKFLLVFFGILVGAAISLWLKDAMSSETVLQDLKTAAIWIGKSALSCVPLIVGGYATRRLTLKAGRFAWLGLNLVLLSVSIAIYLRLDSVLFGRPTYIEFVRLYWWLLAMYAVCLFVAAFVRPDPNRNASK